jgi:proteasome assembly chaperone (PAC2) family protein
LKARQPFKLFAKPKLESSSLVVAWNQDVGKIGVNVADYLNRKLKSRKLAEISPEGFFSLGGVSVEDDVAQFPESKFYLCPGKSLVVLRSDIPRHDWYEFLNVALDIAEKYCKVKEIYTIGGMVSPGAHTTPRVLLSVANSAEMKKTLSRHDIVSDMDYETRDDQRPTFSSFLLWAAKRRNIAGASFWVPIPFYLLSVEDPQALKNVIEFFNRHLGLNIDFADLDGEVARQGKEIAQMRSKFPELDGYISRLESNLGLTVDESEKLARGVEEWLIGRR